MNLPKKNISIQSLNDKFKDHKLQQFKDKTNCIIKNKPKNTSNLFLKSNRVSILQSQQIGNNQYKKAMKHMVHLKMLQQQSQKLNKQQKITQQHTFKPKINLGLKTQYFKNKNQDFINSNNLLNKNLTTQGYKSKKNKNQAIYDRLMKWGKNQDERRRKNYIKGKIHNFQYHQTSLELSREKIFSDISQSYSVQKNDFKKQKSLKNSKNQQNSKITIKGQQDYYLRQARASALKNGQIFYYKTTDQ